MTDTHTHPFRYAAFISYSHADEAAAGWLHRALEGFKPPEGLAIPAKDALPRADKLAPVFRDREELASGADLPSLITTALEASGALIVLCSPRSAQSQWVNQEIRAFRDLHGDARIFALIVEGDPADEVSCFPPALIEKVGHDGVVLPEPREPLAADIRPGKDGKPLAKLKLAAGLMGVGLDDLARREDARARKRMMAVTAASLTGMVFAAGLAAVALLSRQEAVRQRARAETEAMTATRTTEFMIDLFEVADPGEARGQSITAKEILDKGVASIETSLEGEPKVQADLMHTMGRAYRGLGLYPDAEDLLRNTRTLKAETDFEQSEIFETDAILGSVLFEREKYSEAQAIFENILNRLNSQTLSAEDSEIYIESLIGLADIKAQSDETLDESIEMYEQALQLVDKYGYGQTELHARALLWYSRPLMYADRNDESFQRLQESYGILKTLYGEQHFLNSVALNELGTLRYFESDFAEAIDYFEQALEVSIVHLGDTHPEVATALNNIGRLKLETGDIPGAYANLKQAIEIQMTLGRETHTSSAFFLNTMSILESEQKNYQEAIYQIETLEKIDLDENHRLTGPIRLNLGRALCGATEFEKGVKAIQEGRELLKASYSSDDWRYGVADEFESFCKYQNGHADEAMSLAKSGYRQLSAARGEKHYFTQRAKAWMERLERG